MSNIWERILTVNSELRNLVPQSKRSKIVSFILVLIGFSFDNMIAASSLTTVFSTTEHFNAETTTVSWVLSAYALTLGSFIMLSGKLTDILGPDIIYIIALFWMSIFSLVTAVADQIIVVIVFRALQGIAASALVPSTFAIAGNYFQGRALKFAIMGIVVSITTILSLGLILGGAFSLSDIGYKGLYYYVFALGISVSVTLYLSMVPVKLTEESRKMKVKNLDIGGSFALVVGFLLIVLGLTEGGESWHKPSSYVPFVIGFLVLTFGLIFELVIMVKLKEQRVQKLKAEGSELESYNPEKDWIYNVEPLIRRETLMIPNMLVFLSSTMFCFLTFFSFYLSLNYYFLYIEYDSPLIAALKVVPIGLGTITGILLNNETIIYKISMKWCLLFSQIMCLGSIIWSSRQTYRHKHNFWIYDVVPQFLYGIGTNTYFGIYLNAIMRNTPPHLQGAVSGLIQTVQKIAIAIASSLVSSITGALLLKRGDENYREKAFTKLKSCWYMCMGTQAAMIISLSFLRNRKSALHSEHDNQEAEHKIEDLSTNVSKENINDKASNETQIRLTDTVKA